MGNLDKTSGSKRATQAVPLPSTRLCGHPELHPTAWGQEKPAPAFMVGCVHNHSCPVCGFGMGMHPHDFNCPDRLGSVTDLLLKAKKPSAGYIKAQS